MLTWAKIESLPQNLEQDNPKPDIQQQLVADIEFISIRNW
jgi:hypothetical protein